MCLHVCASLSAHTRTHSLFLSCKLLEEFTPIHPLTHASTCAHLTCTPNPQTHTHTLAHSSLPVKATHTWEIQRAIPLGLNVCVRVGVASRVWQHFAGSFLYFLLADLSSLSFVSKQSFAPNGQRQCLTSFNVVCMFV